VNTSDNSKVFVFAWIDFNQDGDFNDIDETYDLGNIRDVVNGVTSISPNITMPIRTVLGAIRMRISAKLTNNSAPTSCETGFDGGVEDYTVNIIDSTLGIEDELLSAFQLCPNPVANGEITLRIPNDITDFKITISNILRQQLFTENVKFISRNIPVVKTQGLKTGIYFVTVSTNLGRASKKLLIH